jgi:hypothetical protein
MTGAGGDRGRHFVLFIADDQQWHTPHVPRLVNLLAQRPYVLDKHMKKL